MKYPGGQSSESVRDDRELTLLTESEFCPPEHHQHAGCAIESDLLTSRRVSVSSVPFQLTFQRNIRGDRVPTLSGMIGNSQYF